MSFAEYIITEVLKPKYLKTLTNAIILRYLPGTVRVGPAVIHVNPNDPVVSGVVALGVFEPTELSFFQKYCVGDMVFIDIGANIGLYSSLALHSLTPAGRIAALEPHPESFAFLQKNINENRKIKGQDNGTLLVDTYNLAASPENGIQTLYLNPENKGDNRLYIGAEKGWESIPVDCLPVDALLDQLGIQQVNFVKMDGQDYEQKVISGFQNTLSRSERVIIMTEFWPKGLLEAGGDAFSYLENLSLLGFKLYILRERPRGSLESLKDRGRLVSRLKGRKYANLVGVKGYHLPGCLITPPEMYNLHP